MDQIIIGVDTHKSSHIAVAINTQGARLGTMTIPTTRQGYRSLEAWQQDLALSKPLVSKALALTALVYPEICKQRDILSWKSFVPIVNSATFMANPTFWVQKALQSRC